MPSNTCTTISQPGPWGSFRSKEGAERQQMQKKIVHNGLWIWLPHNPNPTLDGDSLPAHCKGQKGTGTILCLQTQK